MSPVFNEENECFWSTYYVSRPLKVFLLKSEVYGTLFPFHEGRTDNNSKQLLSANWMTGYCSKCF